MLGESQVEAHAAAAVMATVAVGQLGTLAGWREAKEARAAEAMMAACQVEVHSNCTRESRYGAFHTQSVLRLKEPGCGTQGAYMDVCTKRHIFAVFLLSVQVRASLPSEQPL